MRAERHVADTVLLQWLDDEVDEIQARAITRHLAACARCRQRHQSLLAAASDIAILVCGRSAESGEHHARARARLRRAMGEPEAAGQSWSSRLLPSIPVRWIVASAIAALAVVAIRQPSTLWHVFDAKDRFVAAGLLPESSLTPGAALPLTAHELCHQGGAAATRVLPATMRQQVLRDYRMEHVASAEYELDYLITPELGGAPHARNLWPQRYASQTWNASVKDQLEELLPRLVCAGELHLQEAQFDIASDWIAAYRKYFRTSQPLRSLADATDDDAPLLFDERVTASLDSTPVRFIRFSARR